jgi:hypothetical protein
VKKATDPVQIHVNPGDPGAENEPPARLQPGQAIASPTKDSKRIFDLFSGTDAGKVADNLNDRLRSGPWRLALFGALALVLALVLWLRFRTALGGAFGKMGARARRKTQHDREWAKIRRQAEEAGRLPFNEILKCFDFLQGQLEEELSERFGITARGLTRDQLQEALVEKGLIPQNLWQRLSELLEFTETVRFASQAGAVSEERARNELRKWTEECEGILEKLRGA